MLLLVVFLKFSITVDLYLLIISLWVLIYITLIYITLFVNVQVLC